MLKLINLILVICGVLFILEKAGLNDEVRALIHGALLKGVEISADEEKKKNEV